MRPPASSPSRRSSTRLAPEATTRSGVPSAVNTSDFTIWATATPSASAACCEVRACTASSITSRASPCAVMAACTFSTAGLTTLEHELGHQVERLGLHRATDECGDARVLPPRQPLADALLRPAECDLVDEGVGHRGRRLVLLATQIEILDAPGVALVAVATHELVVEVLAARAHAAHVKGQARLHHRAAGRRVRAQHDRHRGRHVEARERLAATRGLEAGVE